MKIRTGILGSLVAFAFVLLLGRAPIHALEPGVVTLVSTGACWSVHDRGEDLGTNWIYFGDDSFWLRGLSELGYGQGDEATLVNFGPDPTNKFVTTYFHHRFLAPQPAVFTNLILNIKRDDGAAVYLNGTEVFRDNLIPAADYITPAAPAADDGTNFISVNVSPSLLRSVDNILAVEVHQAATNDPDLSFELSLVGQYQTPTPVLFASLTGASNIVLSWPTANSVGFSLQSSSTLVSNSWVTVTNEPIFSGGLLRVTNARAFPPRFYRLAATTNAAPCQPPIVLNQPLNVVAAVGSTVTLSPDITGTQPITYQWHKNLVPIPGATSATLTLSNVLRADGGAYALAMKGACDGNWSYPISVTVGGTNADLADTFALRQTFTDNLGELNSSNYFATAEPGEPAHAGSGPLRSLWLEYQPQADGIVTFTTTGSGFDTLLAAYYGTNVAALDLIDADDDQSANYTSLISFAVTNGGTVQVAVASYPDSSGTVQLNWTLAVTTNVVPLILVQPQSQIVAAGSNCTFSVVATNPAPFGTLTYQWQFNGSNIAGAVSSSLVITNVQAINTGNYNVLVSNGTNTKKSQYAGLIQSVATGQTITLTTANKSQACNSTSYYYSQFSNPAAGSNGYFDLPSEPVTVTAWTSSGKTALASPPPYVNDYKPLFGQVMKCIVAGTAAKVPGNGLKYRFEILAKPGTYYVEHSP